MLYLRKLDNQSKLQQLMGKITSLVKGFLVFCCVLVRIFLNSQAELGLGSRTIISLNPSSMFIMRGNCADMNISLVDAPASDLTIDFTPPDNLSSILSIANQSGYTITFNNSEAQKLIKMCVPADALVDSFSYFPILGGTDAPNYKFFFELQITVWHRDYVYVPLRVSIWKGMCLQYTSSYSGILVRQSALTVSFNSSLPDGSHLFVHQNNRFTFPGGTTTQTFYICASPGAPLGLAKLYPYLSGSGSELFQMILPYINVTIMERTNAPKLFLPLTEINVVLGGCSLPFNLTLSEPPASDLTIDLSDQLADNGQTTTFMYLKNSVSPAALTFNSSTKHIECSLCVSRMISYEISEINIMVKLSGTNAGDYTINYDEQSTGAMEFLVVLAYPRYNISIYPDAAKSGLDLSINLTSNLDSPSPYVSETYWSYYVWTESDTPPVGTNLYNTDDFPDGYLSYFTAYTERAGYIYLDKRQVQAYRTFPVYAGKNVTAFVAASYPDTNYTFCMFVKDDTNAHDYDNTTFGSCQLFKSAALPWPIYKAELQFQRQLTNTERLQLLCFVDAQVNVAFVLTINEYGEHCKTGVRAFDIPIGVYSGDEIALDNATTVYLKTKDVDVQGVSAQNFLNMFENPANLPALTANITTIVGVKLLSVNTDNIHFSTMRSLSPNLTIETFEFENNSKVILRNLSIDGTGVFYAGIGLGEHPNFQQLVNCMNSSNASLVECKRLFLKSGQVQKNVIQTTNLTFSSLNLQQNSNLFYGLANQFPHRITNVTPVFLKKIDSTKKAIVSGSSTITIAIVLVALFIF